MSSFEQGISHGVASTKKNTSLFSAVLGNLAFLNRPIYTQEFDESTCAVRNLKFRIASFPKSAAEQDGLVCENKHPS
jgi:hypothetical protein